MSASVVCRRCGTSNDPADRFCGSCGAFLEWEGEPTPSDEPTAAEPPPPGAAVPPEPVGAAVEPTAASPTIPTEPVAAPTAACTACGAVNAVGRTFCQSCGARLRPAEPAGAASTGAASRPPTRPASSPRPSPRGLPGWLLPVIGLGVVAGIAVVAAASLLGPGEAPSGATFAPASGPATLTPTLPPTPPLASPSDGPVASGESTAIAVAGASASSVDGDAGDATAAQAIDGRIDTAWREGGGEEAGQWIELTFGPATLDHVVIYAGDQASADAFLGQRRPRDVLVSVDGGPPVAFLLADSQQPQRLDIGLATGATTVRIELASTYDAEATGLSGSPRDVAAISEIRLFGWPGG